MGFKGRGRECGGEENSWRDRACEEASGGGDGTMQGRVAVRVAKRRYPVGVLGQGVHG